MNNQNDLNRFVEAHQRDYQRALSEIKSGRKQTHWMWYIFPQIQGLSLSDTARYYSIRDIKEAEAFFKHPVLGSNLVNICNELLALKETDAHKILGSPDDVKLRSSMTLFALLPDANPVFESVLRKFYNGEKDDKTLQVLEKQG